jgi:hypothetical protein
MFYLNMYLLQFYFVKLWHTFSSTCISKNVFECILKHALLKNVGAVHYSPFIRPVSSLLLYWSPFTTTNEFTQNPVKSLGV